VSILCLLVSIIMFLPLCLASLAHQQKLHQLAQFSGGPTNKYGCCGHERRPLGFNLNNNPGSFSNEEYGGKDLEADVMFKSSSELAISAQSQLSETPAATLLPAVLGDLRISGADLEPSFNATVFSYSAVMGEYVSFVKITPVLPPGHIVQGGVLLAISSAKNRLGFLQFRGRTPSAIIYTQAYSQRWGGCFST
jgi:hypothetical protein